MKHLKNFYMQVIPDVDDAFGFGDTEQTFEERQKMSDYSKVKGFAWALRHEKWEVFEWWENCCVIDRPHHQDKLVHTYLNSIPGIEQDDEVFRFKKGFGLTLEIIRDMIHKKFFPDILPIREPLNLRPHQREFVAKAQAEYLEFLLFAKCRAGKSIMALSHVVDCKFKATLIVSRHNSPIQSWKEDIDKFDKFDNLVFISMKDNNYIQQINYWYNTDKQLVIWSTVQGYRKIQELPIDIDLLVYDEAHVGYKSNQWNTLRETITCPVLYVTGTAYKMVWDFPEQDRFIYSYFEEQLDKKKRLNNRPSMRVILANYQSSQYQSLFGDDPDAMKNIFNVNDQGEFVNPSLVQDFVINRFATQRVLRPQHRLLKDSTHLYITLPSVDACHAFAEYMKETRFSPLVVTGDTKKDAADINKHIEENPTGSCILTRVANVLGVTASKVDTVINCAEGSSIEFWTQFAFRGGSSDNDWQVIDFCPQRCLESLRQTFVAACDTNSEVSEYDLTDFVVISEWSEGFTTLTSDRVNEILSADVGNAIRLVSGLANNLDYNKLRDLDFNLYLKPSGDNVTKSIQLNDNNSNGKTNKKRLNELSKSDKDEIYQKIDTIQSILERIPLVLFHAINAGEKLNTIDSVIESNHYQPVTLDDENIVQMALNYDVIDRKSLSYRISRAYVDVQHAIQQDKLNALSVLSQSAQTQQDIPLELLEDMLSCVS